MPKFDSSRFAVGMIGTAFLLLSLLEVNEQLAVIVTAIITGITYTYMEIE